MTTDVDGNYRGAYTYANGERISVEDLGQVEGTPNDPLYYLNDAQGTTAAITNMNAGIIDNYRFAPYGEPLSPVAKNSRLTNSPWGYTGESHDIEAGLVYLRARYYEPGTGRFIQQDSYLGDINNPMSRNLYAYCLNSPITRIDPSGFDSYILYDPYTKSGDGKHTFYNEALIRKEQLEEQYGTPVHIISTANATEFKNAWNNKVGYNDKGKPVSIDEVVIILHGKAATVKGTFKDIGYGFMYFEKGTRITTGKDITRKGDVGIWELDKKEIGTLYFSSCNSGNPDIVNVAE